MAAFDCESTGTDIETARIVSTTVVHIVPGSETEVASHLIAVDVDIPEQATAVHGITTEYARENGKPAVEVLESVTAQLAEVMANGIPVVGCNLSYDFTLLDRELRRNGLTTLDARLGRPIGPVVDVFVIDKALDRYRKGGRKLVDMCATYGARITDAHDATADALAAARIAYKMGRRAGLDMAALRDLYGDRLVALCGDGVRGCHGWAHHNRRAARDLGLIIKPTDDPAAVAVEHAQLGRVFLLAGGGWSTRAPEVAA